MEELIKQWKEYKIKRAEFEFYAGGDSMGDTELRFYDEKESEIDVKQFFINEIENAIYKNVEFYSNSDGHYMGELGVVVITLNESEKEPYFDFEKNAKSEYSNPYVDEVQIEFNEKQFAYLKNYVKDICSSSDNASFCYKKDFFVSDEMEEIEKSIQNVIQQFCDDHEFEYNGDGELEEMNEHYISDFKFLENNKISINLEYRVTEYEDNN